LEQIFVYGAGGHAKVVISIIEAQGIYGVAVVADDSADMEGGVLLGRNVVIGREGFLEKTRAAGVTRGIVAVGDNRSRLLLALWASRMGLKLVTAIHPSAIVGPGCNIGAGSVLMAGTVINIDTTVGGSAIINTSASVDHDCIIGDGVHVAPGCRLCGGVTVKEGALIGAGSVLVPGVTVGRDAVVGAGSVVIRDIPDETVAAGNPCRSFGKAAL
jgi:sugar O-acyltransferase (sialic acid O-acetyltransferase NeuD family)